MHDLNRKENETIKSIEPRKRAPGGGRKPKDPSGSAQELFRLRLTEEDKRWVMEHGGSEYVRNLVHIDRSRTVERTTIDFLEPKQLAAAWQALAAKGYDVAAPDPESGERWHYIGTVTNQEGITHKFRHRSLKGRSFIVRIADQPAKIE